MSEDIIKIYTLLPPQNCSKSKKEAPLRILSTARDSTSRDAWPRPRERLITYSARSLKIRGPGVGLAAAGSPVTRMSSLYSFFFDKFIYLFWETAGARVGEGQREERENPKAALSRQHRAQRAA